MTRPKKNRLYHVLFVLFCAAVLLFLLKAPPETTAPVPRDEQHQPFWSMSKKEAERHCEQCHAPGKEAPLPEKHPPKYRCLFCHKRM
ncbi:MAG: hypothetical protein ACOX5Z_00960 [Desulfobulbus sp.]|jgi:hypothetical protein